MGTFDLKGKIISKDQLPLKDLKIEAYDDDALLNPDDFLGKTATDSNGLFKIDFDESKFSGFLEGLEGTPDVYLIVKEKEDDEEDHNAADDDDNDDDDDQAKQLLKTRTMKTKKEIEYHIRILDDSNNTTVPNPNAIDIYSGNARRMISMLNEVGNLIGIENRINLDILNNGNPSEDIRQKLQNFVKEYEDRRNNFNYFAVILSTLVDSFLEEIRIGNIIGYDGPQVPRQPRRTPYNQVIIWPRNEEFKWA